MSSLWLIHLNPFFWEAVVFAFFGFVVAFALYALHGLPRRLLESL